jgi:hypothetical protein
MARRRLLTFVVVAGSLAGAVAWRRRQALRRERVDLYFADGSMISLDQGALEADRLLPMAREVLDAAHGT